MSIEKHTTPQTINVTPVAGAELAQERPRSLGERMFDYITYGGIGFGLNLGLSVLITDYFTHGNGEKLLQQLTKKSTGAIHGVSGIAPKKLENTVYSFWKTNLLMSGGHVVMIPIKLMEDSKRHMVHRLNLMLGVDQPILKNGEIVPVSSLSEDELPHLSEDQPKQSWLRTAYRRVLGISATMALGTMMGKQRMHDVEDVLTDKLILPSMRATPIKSVQNIAENERFQRYAKLVSLDQFFTVITSGIAYITNGAKKHEGGDLPPLEPAPEYMTNSDSTHILAFGPQTKTHTHNVDSHRQPLPIPIVAEHVISDSYQPQTVGMEA